MTAVLAGEVSVAEQKIDYESIRATKRVEALRINEPVSVDGRLTEPAWELAQPARDFSQQIPDEGELTTEPTEVRFLYDEENLYVGGFLWDSEPERTITNELKRDFGFRNGDGFCLVLDTFNDKRNTVSFMTNPAGAKRDIQTYDEARETNQDWDAVWYVKTGRFEGGWTVEMAIPFKSLRFFESGGTQEWGLQIMRIIRRKNEITMWSPVPRQFNQFRNAYHGVLTGIRQVRPGHNFWLKPFAISELHRNKDETDRLWTNSPDGGFDLKYGVASSLTLDGSYRTDFAQVEADEQQINLTRFSLFFPEKREFFLENQGSFRVGDQARRGVGDDPFLIPFFSRRIGLRSGEPVPIVGGARLTGKIGRNGVGLLNMQTEEDAGEPASNYTALRFSREVMRNSALGGFYLGRESEGDYNRVMGADARFNFRRTLDLDAYVLKSSAPEIDRDPWAGRGALRLATDLYTARLAYTHIGAGYRNDLGFTPRTDVGILSWEIERNLRPRATYQWVRQYTIGTQGFLYTDADMEEQLTRLVRFDFGAEFADGGRFELFHDRNYELLEDPFEIHQGVVIPEDVYRFNQTQVTYDSDSSKWLSGNVSYQTGDFWTGNIRRVSTGLRIRASQQLALASTYERNRVRLEEGNFTTDLLRFRVDYSFSTRMFLNAFIQYNSVADAWLTNIRFNFIHRPLSDLYVVYNETRLLREPTQRSLIVKYTHRIAF